MVATVPSGSAAGKESPSPPPKEATPPFPCNKFPKYLQIEKLLPIFAADNHPTIWTHHSTPNPTSIPIPTDTTPKWGTASHPYRHKIQVSSHHKTQGHHKTQVSSHHKTQEHHKIQVSSHHKTQHRFHPKTQGHPKTPPLSELPGESNRSHHKTPPLSEGFRHRAPPLSEGGGGRLPDLSAASFGFGSPSPSSS